MGMTFTRLASEHFLKVRGNTHLQVELKKKKVISKYCSPTPGPSDLSMQASDRPARRQEVWPGPGPCGVRWGRNGADKAVGPGGWGPSRSCDSAPGWGTRLFPFALCGFGVWLGAEPGADEVGEGRGAFTVQDARRRRAEVTRLLLGAGLAAPSPGSKPAPLQIQISVTLHRNH